MFGIHPAGHILCQVRYIVIKGYDISLGILHAKFIHLFNMHFVPGVCLGSANSNLHKHPEYTICRRYYIIA